MDDVYERLALYLDSLPCGYPRTESGVEMRILRKLFTPDEAELALHLNLVPETTSVIAFRAGIPQPEAARRLSEMDSKGLLFGFYPDGKPAEYAIQQFAVGFWEGQVNRLDQDLAKDFEEYLPVFFEPEFWRKAPQLRTIPIGESIPSQMEVMPYERVEDIVRSQRVIAVANCICRQEMRVLDKACGKPEETCLSFGVVAEAYIRTGRGRAITQDEALTILHHAEQSGLILQPGNSQDTLAICACCSCCCGVLRSLKRHPKPASLVASSFRASLDPESCTGCGACEESCQMDAIYLKDGLAELDLDRCIGCGLCIRSCPSQALALARKPQEEQPYLPRDVMQNYLQLWQARGKAGRRELVAMLSKSRQDRQQAAQ